MPDITTKPDAEPPAPGRNSLRRLGWFVAFYFASLAVWLVFSYGLRALMGLGGS